MIRLTIVVEGETEEAFVNQVLADHLRPIETTPILLGGNVTVERLAAHMVRMDRDCQPVTSFVDFYGFADKGSDAVCELERRISDAIQARIGRPLDSSRVFPYVQTHEFEGLLFTDAEAFAVVPNATRAIIEELKNIRSCFGTPEDINDSKKTAPSKRIESLLPRYRKVVHGPDIFADIGLKAIRGECPRFDGWLTRLESLGGGAG